MLGGVNVWDTGRKASISVLAKSSVAAFWILALNILIITVTFETIVVMALGIFLSPRVIHEINRKTG